MADDDDEHKQSEGGETMMSDDDNLMKGRAEERERGNVWIWFGGHGCEYGH